MNSTEVKNRVWLFADRRICHGVTYLFSHRYSHPALEELCDGTPVSIAYNSKDDAAVWIYDQENNFICKAEKTTTIATQIGDQS